MKKAVISVVFALALLMTACSADNAAPDTSHSAASDTPESVAETEATLFPDYLGERNFEGATLRLAVNEGGEQYFMRSESAGDVLNDTVYEAVGAAMEKYNFVYEPFFYAAANTSVEGYITSSVMAGDACEIIVGHDGAMWRSALGGYFYDMRTTEHQDFSQPWWPEFVNDQLEVNNKQFIFSSFMSYRMISYARCLMVNKAMLADRGIAIPYDDVLNKTWTLDKFYSLARDIYIDENGDGKANSGDVYGWAANVKMYGLQGAYVNCYAEGNDGFVKLDFNVERLVDLIDGLRGVLCDSVGGFIYGNEPSSDMFVNNQSLFFYATLEDMTTEKVRDSEIDYTVLPLPLYDENSKTYITPTFDAHCAIPVNEDDVDMVSFLIEALSSIGYNRVRGAYYDSTLSRKYAADRETSDMLEIITDNLIVDLSYLNTDGGTNGLGRTVMYGLANPSAGIASYIESINAPELKKIETMNNYYHDIVVETSGEAEG